jgi:hypothetical protein
MQLKGTDVLNLRRFKYIRGSVDIQCQGGIGGWSCDRVSTRIYTATFWRGVQILSDFSTIHYEPAHRLSLTCSPI